ncbi:precorrin-6A synthase (deacetylating) [Methylocella silvestris BL2]|uniref:Precorrin-6A synthase [deacetylating] n=1 Tax=Methylocella silvestris (strain DSM 15510 / CIP 108128 / LMG 27833 / NCIMB 13906 / BL2) TaxID=395965 RepID=B8EQC5_METSB|nr:precorrin-6A synthase (deacetylating) [Methylocella silvestris]ACK52138.1 precorrin-6A synthase (deacetylating) [Methylocella silvestris BL2]
MRKILIIGVGAGDPAQITIQAIEALNRADVFFIPDKGAEKSGLRQQRLKICDRYLKSAAHRFVEYKTPSRAKTPDYKADVAAWHEAIAATFEALFARELTEDQCGAFLVWGDPALYDSTLRIVETLHARGAVTFDYEIIPGISSVQALAAQHKIALNRIGEPVHITTGRKLRENVPENADSVVVMLDGEESFAALDDEDLEIFWGANIGCPEQALASGRLGDVKDRIKELRAKVRAAAGWVMDVYLLRKPMR